MLTSFTAYRRNSEIKYHQVFQHASNAHVVGRIAEDTTLPFIEANKKFCEMYGYSLSEVLRMLPEDFIHPNYREENARMFQTLFQTGEVSGETVHITKAGTPIRIELSARLFTMNGQKFYSTIMRDITERKKIEKELKESEERYRRLVEHSPCTIVVHTVDTCLYMNQAGLDLFGIQQPDTFAGRSIFDYIYPEDRVLISKNLKAFQAGYQPINHARHRLKREDGEAVHVHIVSITITYEGRHAFMSVIQDITHHKKMEEALRRTDMLSVAGNLAAGVAHEVRNPLTVLNGFLQMLKKDSPHKYFDIMLSEVERIELIISEFLMLSKPQVSTYSQHNVVEILTSIVALYETQAVLNGIEVIYTVEPFTSSIECEPNQLKQVFMNLFKNALEAMPDGGRIFVTVSHSVDNLYIRFADEGCGIPPDKLARLGEPFYTTKERGTGLGLMVSYNIIKNHNGLISVTSEPGKGTCFEITLPIQRVVVYS